MLYLSRYTVDRRYGGPEEGGWWYDDYTFEAIVGTYREDDADAAYTAMRNLNAREQTRREQDGERDRYSMIGGPDTEWHVEDAPREHETTVRPHYE